MSWPSKLTMRGGWDSRPSVYNNQVRVKSGARSGRGSALICSSRISSGWPVRFARRLVVDLSSFATVSIASSSDTAASCGKCKAPPARELCRILGDDVDQAAL